MSDKPRACWYRRRVKNAIKWTTSQPKAGLFYQFASDYEEFESGPESYPVAIVEDVETGAVHVVLAEDVCFGTKPKFAKE